MSTEQEAKLKEIVDILLSAGYFRCRIPSISNFDKILGGMAWCISCSNFDIDVEFQDDMNMGQKIKLSEKVVDCLLKMDCPYRLQPFQIQGLDLANIYPVIQWLIKFVLETRDIRQDFNKSVSLFKGDQFYEKKRSQKTKISEDIFKNQNLREKRVAKNSKSIKYHKSDPLKIYSSLIEFDDKTAIRTYNRLNTYLTNEEKRKEQKESGQGPQNVGITKTSLKPKKGQQQKEEENVLESALFAPDMDNTEEVNPDALEFIEIRRERRGSVSGTNLYQIVNENRDNIMQSVQAYEQEKEDDQDDIARMIAEEKAFYEEQQEGIKAQIEKLQDKINNRKGQLGEVEDDVGQVKGIYDEIKGMNTELTETQQIIMQKIAKLRQKLPASKVQAIEEMIERKKELKAERTDLKKTVKSEMARVQEEKQEIEEAWPMYEDPIDEETRQEYNEKKEKYDNRFKEFAKTNQQIAVLQRKIEGYPSSIETAQYYKRFIELYERINFEMEVYRDNFLKYNNFQDKKQCIVQQVDIWKSFKEGVMGLGKSKSAKEEFIKNLQKALEGLKQNEKMSLDLLTKVKTNKEKNNDEYNKLLNAERQYYTLLRELQTEYEKNDKLIDVLGLQ